MYTGTRTGSTHEFVAQHPHGTTRQLVVAQHKRDTRLQSGFPSDCVHISSIHANAARRLQRVPQGLHLIAQKFKEVDREGVSADVWVVDAHFTTSILSGNGFRRSMARNHEKTALAHNVACFRIWGKHRVRRACEERGAGAGSEGACEGRAQRCKHPTSTAPKSASW